MTSMRYGPRGLLLRATDDREYEALTSLTKALDSSPPLGFREWVIAEDSLLTLWHHTPDEAGLLSLLGSTEATPTSELKTHTIKVVYDGPDLADTAKALHLTSEELVTRHTAATYRVKFMGFMPGFAYLNGLPDLLRIPRRTSPRPRMAKGAVAIGGPYAGIYTVPSPGGWHWLGNTDALLFDKAAGSPFAFAVGDLVRFEVAGDHHRIPHR